MWSTTVFWILLFRLQFCAEAEKRIEVQTANRAQDRLNPARPVLPCEMMSDSIKNSKPDKTRPPSPWRRNQSRFSSMSNTSSNQYTTAPFGTHFGMLIFEGFLKFFGHIAQAGFAHLVVPLDAFNARRVRLLRNPGCDRVIVCAGGDKRPERFGIDAGESEKIPVKRQSK